MISYVVKSFNGQPFIASTILLATVYALSIAPNFTRDAYLKLLPVFLIPAVMIASSDSTGFALNIELILGAGIICAIYIKILDLFQRTRSLLKNPQEKKLDSAVVYISIFVAFMGAYGILGKIFGVPYHLPAPQAKSPAYFLLITVYVVTALASIIGLRLGIGSKNTE